MDQAGVACRESSILLKDIVISSSNQTSPSLLDNFHVYVDILASQSGGKSIDGGIPTKLMIRRLGPFELAQEDSLIFWQTNESVEVPLSMDHVDIVVSTERMNGSGSDKHGCFILELDHILDWLFLEEEGEINIEGDTADIDRQDLSIRSFTCMIIPGNKMMLSDAYEHEELSLANIRDQRTYAWLKDESTKLQLLHRLGHFFDQRFERTQDIPDIDMTIAYETEIVKMTPDGDPLKHSIFTNLGISLWRRFEQLGDLNDLNKFILMMEKAIQLTPDSHPDKPERLSELGCSFLRRFEHLGDLSDIKESILRMGQAVQLAPDGHPDKPSWFNNFGNSLLSRFERLGDLNDLEESILLMEQAVQATPDGHPNKPSRLNSFGNSLLRRFEHLGNLHDLNESILKYNKAVQLTPDGHPDKPSWLSNLGSSLLTRFGRLEDINDINESILVQEKAIQLTPDVHPHKPSMMNSLGHSFLRRFERLRDLNDLNESILKYNKAVQLTPDGHPDKPSRFNSLGNSLLSRFDHVGNLSDIEESILVMRNAVQLIPDGHPDKPSWFNNFGNSLFTRFGRLGNLNDLEESILLMEQAVQTTPDGHPNKPSRLNSFGNSLLRRFEHLGNLHDLNESILKYNKAVQFTPDGHPDKPLRLSNLGSSLRTRFERLGDINDINESILVQEKAIQLTPDVHPHKPLGLTNLGNSLLRRFDRLGDLKDLNESILVQEQAVQFTPDGHPDNPDGHPEKPSRLNNFGNSLLTRFERLGDINDLNLSILVNEKAVQITPDGHPDKPARLFNFGNSILTRFERLGDINDVNTSILVTKKAVQLTADDHPDKSSMLFNLGSSLLIRFEHVNNHDDQIRSMKCYSFASLAITGHPSTQFHASSQWALLAEYANDEISRLEAYSTALSLLPRLAWLGSHIEDRHFDIKKTGEVVRRAAAAAIEDKNPKTSVEWLEQGRSIIWGQLLQLRIPIDRLLSSHPVLGEKLRTLSSQLEGVNIVRHSTLSASSASHMLPDYHAIAHERESLINNIRQLPGFDHFLLPKPISELTRAAQLGPVVVLNATGKRCDALALFPGLDDAVLHIPLSDIALNDIELLGRDLRQLIQDDSPAVDILFDRYRDAKRLGVTLVSQESDYSYQERRDKVFQGILLKLWDCVIEPVVQRLGLKIHTLSRIWWCPTGPFSFLPLHAAGNYSTDAAVGSKLMDYAISSYTPSLTSLIQALDSAPNILSNSPRLLVVAQSSATGQAHIQGTLRELRIIKDLAASSDNIAIEALSGSDATISRVKEEMGNASWAHFACHGVQNGKSPTQSALLLSGDSRLTLSEIIGMKMPSKDFAFLSACQTGTGDEKLSDESVHLAAGMLSAGYRGVIATMWSISDLYAPTVAKDVYTHLFKKQIPDSTDAAEALHYAVKNLQQNPGVSFVDWVPFIHMGL